MTNNDSTTLIKIKKNYQITLPRNLRKKLNVSEGDYVDVKVDKKGRIYIGSVKMIDPEQAYFWTKEWQENEKEADEDIAKGRVSKPLKSVKELMQHLRS